MSNTGSEDCLENLQDPASDIDQLQRRQWTSFLQILQNRQRGKSSVTTRMLVDRDAQFDAKQV
jgi:hypothetical protein